MCSVINLLMKKILFLALLLIFNSKAYCCTSCNPQIRDAIYDSTFYPNLFVMLSAFFVLGIIVAVLTWLANKRFVARTTNYPRNEVMSPVPLTSAALVIGIGMGGFIDGIVFHQILQWHEMLSNKMPPATLLAKSVNMFWDGIFHFFCLVVVLIGVTLLWKVATKKAVDLSGKILIGGLLAGWGIFNIVEGIIDHHLIKLHNVKELSLNPDIWNFSFLALSIIMIIVGYLLINKRERKHSSAQLLQN